MTWKVLFIYLHTENFISKDLSFIKFPIWKTLFKEKWNCRYADMVPYFLKFYNGASHCSNYGIMFVKPSSQNGFSRQLPIANIFLLVFLYTTPQCLSLFAALIASTFLFFVSFCVSSRLPSSLQSPQQLSLFVELMVYSLVFVLIISNHCWVIFMDMSSFIFSITLTLVDILLISSAYCWSMSIWQFCGTTRYFLWQYVPLKKACD